MSSGISAEELQRRFFGDLVLLLNLKCAQANLYTFVMKMCMM